MSILFFESSARWIDHLVYFSSIYVKSGYWQIKVREKDREKTGFVTPGELYELKVMPFGLRTEPASFQCVINTMSAGLKWQSCLVSFDYVMVELHSKPDSNYHRESMSAVAWVINKFRPYLHGSVSGGYIYRLLC